MFSKDFASILEVFSQDFTRINMYLMISEDYGSILERIPEHNSQFHILQFHIL